MATLKQAERAARKVQATMRRRGALAIDARKLPRGTGHAVYVYFETPPDPPLARTVTVRDGGRDVEVPLRVVITERFVPE
jgi:hypothetical protein